jgi:hypothetical protein
LMIVRSCTADCTDVQQDQDSSTDTDRGGVACFNNDGACPIIDCG